jgi:hypothetical protein
VVGRDVTDFGENGTDVEDLNYDPERDMYLGVYGSLGFGQVLSLDYFINKLPPYTT